MKIKHLVKFILLISSSISYSQSTISPLEIPLNLSGTFGELRNTHFHTGIDIKTKGKQGLKVRSIKNGDLVRVRVNKGGYGKSLYIKHTDGTTSVYAHLKKFSKKIETYVKMIQYKKKSYEIQDFPEAGVISFNARELIGFSGNTGGSSGPHLHFEIRSSETNNPLNPIKFGLNIIDTIKPKVNGLYLYKVYKDGKYDFLKKIEIKKINDGSYVASTINYTGSLGIGLSYFDRQDQSYSKNGVYSLDFNLNNNPTFNYKMDELSFNDKRHLKLLIDLEKWNLEKNKIQKLFTHPKSKYSFISNSNSYGVFTILDNESSTGSIKIIDFKGNRTDIKLKFEGIIKDSLKNISNKNTINPDYEYNIDLDGISVKFLKNSFYNPINLNIKSNNDTLYLGENIHPLNKSFEINFLITNNDSVTLKKGFISKINKHGKPLFLKTRKVDSLWTVKVSELGKYSLSIDTIPPIIKPLNFKKNEWVSSLKFLKLKVKDDLSGIKSVEGSINGSWVLFEHEPKNSIITYNFSDLYFPNGKHILKIKVEDLNGNESQYESVFFKKY
jgi:hypothetical protein